MGSIFCTTDWMWQFCRSHDQCSVQWKVLHITHFQVILNGDTSMCSQNYFSFTASCMYTELRHKNQLLGLPCLEYLMCSCWAPSTLGVFDDKSGGLQISRNRWAILNKWIHPWQPMNDVTIVILSLILYFLCCAVVYTMNYELKWNSFRGKLLLMERAGRWRNIVDLQVNMMTGIFIIVTRLEIWRCFHPLKRLTPLGEA